MNKNFIVLLTIFTITITANAQNLTGKEIAQKVKDRPDGNTRTAEMKLTLINKNGSRRDRKIRSYAMDIGKDTKQIMFFLYPGDVKGTGFLTFDYNAIGKPDDKWLYLPAMKKTRRISGKSSKTDYFMGTDFTYDDMGKRNVEEDSHTLLREESRNEKKYWVLESIPQKGDDLYAKRISWIRQDCLIADKVEYYDKLGKLQRIFTVKEIRQINGIWSICKMEMENVQTSHKTEIILENQQYDITVNPQTFTIPRLERGL